MPLEDALAQACGAGVKAVQIREKDLKPEALLALTFKVQSALESLGTKVFIQARPDIAVIAGLTGVHLPAVKLERIEQVRDKFQGPLMIGVSTHSAEEAKRAEQLGADFVVFGPVFETPSKAVYGPPKGLGALKAVASQCKLPVFAIGGIKPLTARSCLDAGAHGVAVISAILAAKDIGGAVKEFQREMGQL